MSAARVIPLPPGIAGPSARRRLSALPLAAFLARDRMLRGAVAVQVTVAVLLGGLAGHTATAAALAGRPVGPLLRGFEAAVASAVLLLAAAEVLLRVGDPVTTGWLRPLLARGVRREAALAAVAGSALLGAGALWAAAAVGFRTGAALAGVPDAAPALALAPPLVTGLMAVGGYGAACALVTPSRRAALGLAAGYPVACALLAIRWVTAHPDAAAPPLLLRIPFLLVPPLRVGPDPAAALGHLVTAALLGLVAVALARRRFGRVP